MNPELTTTLAAQHSRELAAQATDRRAPARQARPAGRRLTSPYRITWTRVNLALTDGGRRSASWTIVISASRAR